MQQKRKKEEIVPDYFSLYFFSLYSPPQCLFSQKSFLFLFVGNLFRKFFMLLYLTGVYIFRYNQKKEFSALAADAGIYKLVGPALLKQDRAEASLAVERRLDFIDKEM